MKTLILLVLVSFTLHAAEIPIVTPPTVATNVARLIPRLTSTNYLDVGKAHVEVVRLGPGALPALVAEMNKTNYVAEKIGPNKLSDMRWGHRMRIAMAIEEISQQDFKCKTSAHGWAPDYSFDAINNWWTNKVLTK